MPLVAGAWELSDMGDLCGVGVCGGRLEAVYRGNLVSYLQVSEFSPCRDRSMCGIMGRSPSAEPVERRFRFGPVASTLAHAVPKRYPTVPSGSI